MNSRTFASDSIALALIYLNQVNKSNIMLLNKGFDFDKVINYNLNEMNSNITEPKYYTYSKEDFYFTAYDGTNCYAVINPKANIAKERKRILEILPLDYIIASQKDNALEILGLELKDGLLTERESIGKSF